ncbi:MAG: FG-GAP repeat domain-containing protein [Phycisphaerales bacterium]
MQLKEIAIGSCLATAGLMTGTASAQVGVPYNPCTIQVNYPNSGGFRALKSAGPNNPVGLPSNSNYPVTVAIGDVDNDGYDDFVFVAEQRLVMAVRVKDATGSLLATPEVIWAHFNPLGSIHKTTTPSADTAMIADFDNDGLNEVAAVISDRNGLPNSNLIAIFETGSGPIDPVIGEPRPKISATLPINSIASNWTAHSTQASGGSNYNVAASNVMGFASTPNEVFLTGTQGGRVGILSYVSGALIPMYTRDFSGSSTHEIKAIDVNGDGHDDILTNGVIDVFNGCEWDFRTSIPYTPVSPNQSMNHADAIAVYDDGSASPPLVIVHNDYDLLVTNGGTTCTPSLIWENDVKNDGTDAIIHGQDVIVANLVDGPDAFGFDGLEIVTIPKGAPLYQAGSVLMNGRSEELIISNNNNQPMPVGPRIGLFESIDWDGGPTTEILSRSHARFSVWSATFDGSDPDLPYVWTEVMGVDVPTGPGTVNGRFARPYDFTTSTPTEELVIFGTRGFLVRQCP